jgi:hypothetical protein
MESGCLLGGSGMKTILRYWVKEALTGFLAAAAVQFVAWAIFRANFIGLWFPVESTLGIVVAMIGWSVIFATVLTLLKTVRIDSTQLEKNDDTPPPQKNDSKP